MFLPGSSVVPTRRRYRTVQVDVDETRGEGSGDSKVECTTEESLRGEPWESNGTESVSVAHEGTGILSM